jgi:transposase
MNQLSWHDQCGLSTQVNDLKEQIKHYQTKSQWYEKKYEEAVQAYDRLLLAFKASRRRVFGASSERFLDANVSQGDFFSAVSAKPLTQEAVNDPELDAVSTSSSNRKPAQKKRAPKNTAFAKNLPRREVIIPAENKGETDRFLRYEITELLNYIPPVYEIIQQKREVWLHPEPSSAPTIIVAANPPRLLPKAKVTETFLAHMIVSKLYDRQPLYHLEKQFVERFDFICPRDKLARWFIESAKHLQPLVNLIRDELIDYDVVGCDPTHLQVLREPGRTPQQKSYVYSIRGGPPDRGIRLFAYQAQDHVSFLKDWFAEYAGYLQVDGQNIFTQFEACEKKALVFCHSHARRKFEPIAKAAKRPGLASQVMAYYRALYKIEREAKVAELTAAERHALRQEKSKPLIDEMFTWMRAVAPTTLPKSPLGLAFQYVLTREKGLRRFLDDGRLEIDTNLIEQQNKNLALARNNFMFSCSVAGARALCVHMSLIFTALAQCLDPYYYYVYIMKRVPLCRTVEDYDALLPWRCKAQVKTDSTEII